MPKQTRSKKSTAARPVDSDVLTFLSRAEQLDARQAQFDHPMRVIKKTRCGDGWSMRSGETVAGTSCGMPNGTSVMASPVARFSLATRGRAATVDIFGRGIR